METNTTQEPQVLKTEAKKMFSPGRIFVGALGLFAFLVLTAAGQRAAAKAVDKLIK